MDNVDILFYLTLGLCILGGVGRLLSWYAKKNTTQSTTDLPPKASPGSLEAEGTVHTPSQSDTLQDNVEATLALVTPDPSGSPTSTVMDFFASPGFLQASDLLLELGIICGLTYVYVFLSNGVPQPPRPVEPRGPATLGITESRVQDPLEPYRRVLSHPQKTNAIVCGLLKESLHTPDVPLILEVRSLLRTYRVAEDIPTLIDALSKKLGTSHVNMVGFLGERCGSVIIPGRPQTSRLVVPEKEYGPMLSGQPVEGKHRPPTTDSTSRQDKEFLRERRFQEFTQNRANTPDDGRRDTGERP